MLHQAPPFFDEIKQAIALALHEAGETDVKIGLAVGVPPMNIADWRRRQGLAENSPALPQEAPSQAQRAEPRRAAASPAPAAPPPVSPPPPTTRPPAAQPSVIRPAAPAPFPLATLRPVPAGVQPQGDDALEVGQDGAGAKVFVDLPELMKTRLLVQGNSGSGKSHLLRRLLEESTGIVQQVVIDPEGDFVTLDAFGHLIVDAAAYSFGQLAGIASRAREHRASVVLDLSRFEAKEDEDETALERQMLAAAAFLTALFIAPKEHWHPVLVIVDEAQVFAPSSSASLDVSKDARRQSVTAMADLMCRGRKRGLAGLLATQRLAKLSTNVAGEASNFLMGRTFFDADIARAGDMLGMKPAQAQQIADLERGEFIGIGPAVARRPIRMRVGDTITASPNKGSELTPLPASGPNLQALLLPPAEHDQPPIARAPELRVVGA